MVIYLGNAVGLPALVTGITFIGIGTGVPLIITWALLAKQKYINSGILPFCDPEPHQVT